jgi:hypothetical protein
MRTNKHAWKHACNVCSSTVKERLSCNRSSQAVKHGCTTMNLQAVSKHGEEIHIITKEKEIQKCAFYEKSDVNTSLGL